jgi:hypothetical protein
MPLMLWVLVGVTVVVVVVIGLLAVGRVTFSLADQTRRSLYDLDEAVQFVGDDLSFETSARITYDDVKRILRWHLDYLEERGIAFEQAAGRDQSAVATGEGGPVVADEDDALAYVLGKVAEAGMDVDDVQVVEVLDGEVRYLEAIGAIGRPVAEPEDPGVA